MNSKFTIDLLTDIETEIEELDENIIIPGLNPHNVHLRNLYKEIKKCERQQKIIEIFISLKEINIIELRDEKIDKILGESYPQIS